MVVVVVVVVISTFDSLLLIFVEDLPNRPYCVDLSVWQLFSLAFVLSLFSHTFRAWFLRRDIQLGLKSNGDFY